MLLTLGDTDDAHGDACAGVAGGLAAVIVCGVDDDAPADDGVVKPGDREVGYVELRNLDNLLGRAITSREVVLSNDPAGDPGSGGSLPMHPPLRHFLGVPVRRGGEIVGMIGVANRRGGYTPAEHARLEPLVQMAGLLFDGYRRMLQEAMLEDQVRQAQKMGALGSLAGGIAHDFNNLLVAITGYSELLLERLQEDDPRRNEVEQILDAGVRAAALTRQLLAFVRRQAIDPKVLDLNVVVARIEKMLRRLLGESIDLVTELNPELSRVKTDPVQVEQILMNLVVNARDALGESGKIIVETANVDLDGDYARDHGAVRPGRYAMLAVTDAGCGMDPETQARVFEAFFTTKGKGQGTGLGLSVVYSIVKQNRGNVWVYSEPGQGTTVKVYLPSVEEPLETPGPSKASRGLPVGTETILLVEDEEIVLAVAREVLERQGYSVLAARGGTEALRICELHKGPIHLMLSDVVMPHMNGKDLADHVLALRPGTRVLFMSGYPGRAISHHQLLDAGVPYLQKPFTPNDLTGKVRELLVSPQISET